MTTAVVVRSTDQINWRRTVKNSSAAFFLCQTWRSALSPLRLRDSDDYARKVYKVCETVHIKWASDYHHHRNLTGTANCADFRVWHVEMLDIFLHCCGSTGPLWSATHLTPCTCRISGAVTTWARSCGALGSTRTGPGRIHLHQDGEEKID